MTGCAAQGCERTIRAPAASVSPCYCFAVLPCYCLLLIGRGPGAETCGVVGVRSRLLRGDARSRADREVQWARLVSNQRPLACEAVVPQARMSVVLRIGYAWMCVDVRGSMR